MNSKPLLVRNGLIAAGGVYGVLAPLLFTLGYGALSLPHAVWLCVAIAGGLLIALLGKRLPWFRVIPCMLFWLLAVDLYFLDANLIYVLCAAIIVAALFQKFPEEFPSITAIFAGIFSITTWVGSWQDCRCLPEWPASAVSESKLAPVVHIMLDGHTGLDNMTMEPDNKSALAAADRIRTVASKHGLVVAQQSFSPMVWTHLSMGLNLNPNIQDMAAILSRDDSGAYEWAMSRASLFNLLEAIGYRLTITQSDFIDYCGAFAKASCRTYRARAADFVQNEGYSTTASLRIAAGMVERSFRARSMLYRDAIYSRALAGTDLWLRGELRPWVGSVGSMQVLNQLTSEASTIQRGSYHFVHLLLPHQPFVFDESCQAIDPEHWLNPMDKMGGRPATERQQHREQYFRQVACLWQKLDLYLAALLQQHPDAVVILHADHGTRIAEGPYRGAAKAPYVNDKDWSDYHSALFATRYPDAANDPIWQTEKPIAVNYLLMKTLADVSAKNGGKRIELRSK